MGEHFIETNGIRIWCDEMGGSDKPAILLAMGVKSQGICWPDRLCGDLARDGFRVLRFDYRDTGLSGCVDFDRHPYSLDDMVGDMAGILDAAGVGEAHLVGTSMGGVLSQMFAANFPERVRSICIIASSCDLSFIKPKRPEDIRILPMAEAIEAQLLEWKKAYGPLPFPEEFFRPIAEGVCHRAVNWPAQYNHYRAFEKTDFGRTSLSGVREIPAVIHGTRDPILPLDTHGMMVLGNIPWARKDIIDGMGHLVAEPFLDRLKDDIVDNARRA